MKPYPNIPRPWRLGADKWANGLAGEWLAATVEETFRRAFVFYNAKPSPYLLRRLAAFTAALREEGRTPPGAEDDV